MGLARSLNRELPSAIVWGSCVRGAAQASGTNAGIDGLSKSLEFHDADALTGKIRQNFAPPSLLHPADIHEEAEALTIIGPLRALQQKGSPQSGVPQNVPYASSRCAQIRAFSILQSSASVRAWLWVSDWFHMVVSAARPAEVRQLLISRLVSTLTDHY